MSPEYLALAEERRSTRCAPHGQPEDFGYDFVNWVSPYTKGAHAIGGVMLVLQDWASKEGLCHTYDPQVQLLGRMPQLLTNRRLEVLLQRVLGLSLGDVYATNVFPFVKGGKMSAPLRTADVLCAARKFVVREIEIAEPTAVLALGSIAHSALHKCGVQSIALPHPAARIGSVAAHESRWREALQSSGYGSMVKDAVA